MPSTLNALHVITIILFVKDNGATFCHAAVVFMNTELLRVVHVIMFITVHVKKSLTNRLSEHTHEI